MRNWLADKRNQLGLTQEEVANRAGIARTTYAMIEQGNRNPSVDVAKSICTILGLSWILFFEDQCHKTCTDTKNEQAATSA